MRKKVVKVEKFSKNKANKIRLKVIATLLMGSIVVGGVAYNINSSINNIRSHEHNTYGYTDITYGNFVKAQDNTFVILNAGDYNTKGEFLFDQKVQYCLDNGMSVGFVINEKATNLDSIYRDVELAKSIISKYDGKIDLPIYFNIDHILENDKLNNTEKIELINTFLEKCQSNGMYVGVQGKNENLCRLKDNCNINGYDACVILEEGKVKTYDGVCNLIQYADGTISAAEDLSVSIKDKNMNSVEKFVYDSTYVVSKDETILDVSLKFNISVYDLLKFNEMSKSDISEGTVLRIPSVLGKSVPIKDNSIKVDDPLLGCDISHYQSYYFDASKLSDSFDFVILKASEGMSSDSSFKFFANECVKYDIPVGAYHLNRVENKSDSLDEIERKIEKETEHFLKTISNNRIEYPVYLDLEGSSEPMLLENPEGFKKIISVWYEKVTDAGYTPGLYMNQSMYKSMINNKIINTPDLPIEENFEMWIAGGRGTYLDESNKEALMAKHFSVEEVKPSSNDLDVGMLQTTNAGDGKSYGAANHLGHLDLCFSYEDYTRAEVGEVDADLLGIKDSFRMPSAETIGVCSTIGGVPLLTVAFAIMKHRKRKSRTR